MIGVYFGHAGDELRLRGEKSSADLEFAPAGVADRRQQRAAFEELGPAGARQRVLRLAIAAG